MGLSCKGEWRRLCDCRCIVGAVLLNKGYFYCLNTLVREKVRLYWSKTREVYTEYRKSGYSKKFRAEHEAEILLHQAAKEYFDSLGDRKLPTVKVLRKEYADLLARKRKAYSEYKRAREEMKELYNVKSNVEHLLNISEPKDEREREKTRR